MILELHILILYFIKQSYHFALDTSFIRAFLKLEYLYIYFIFKLFDDLTLPTSVFSFSG